MSESTPNPPVAQTVQHLVSSASKRDVAVTPDTAIVTDLGLESIQVIELLCEVEDHFDLAIEEDALADIQTVGDLTAVVERMLKGST